MATSEVGNPVLNWIEQAGTLNADPETLDTTPPEITEAGISPNPLYVSSWNYATPVQMEFNVTVFDNSGVADWYVAGVTSTQDEAGLYEGDTGPDWWFELDDAKSLRLNAEIASYFGGEQGPRIASVFVENSTRTYTVTLEAVDMAGNVSEPVTLEVPVLYDYEQQ